jgi:hypothetical protein
MTWLLLALGLYFVWHIGRGRSRDARVRYHAQPYVERYRPPQVVFGAEKPDVPVYPADHHPLRARADIAGEQTFFRCACGADVPVTRSDEAMASKPLRAIETAFRRHAAEYEACRL